MTRVDRFSKGLIFAALAALAAVCGVMLLGPRFGAGATASALFAALGVLWLYLIAPRPAQGFTAAMVVGGVLAVWLLVWPHPALTALGVTALVGVTRGVFFRAGPPARRVLSEGLVAVGSLGLAALFVPGGLTGLGLAVWAWCLVQSLPLLMGAPAAKAVGAGDAFEAAMSRAERILQR